MQNALSRPPCANGHTPEPIKHQMSEPTSCLTGCTAIPDEIAILERYDRQRKTPGGMLGKLKEQRLAKARALVPDHPPKRLRALFKPPAFVLGITKSQQPELFCYRAMLSGERYPKGSALCSIVHHRKFLVSAVVQEHLGVRSS